MEFLSFLADAEPEQLSGIRSPVMKRLDYNRMTFKNQKASGTKKR